MARKISYNEIRDINEDWAYDDRNGNPYSGKSVQDFIKQQLGSKGGDFYYDADTSRYLIFSDRTNRELYLSDRERYTDLLIGSFDAPSNYTAEITLITPVSNVILSGTKGNYIDFTFDVKNKNGTSTGEAVIATFTFSNAGAQQKVTQIYDAGTRVHLLVDDYLKDGANNISIVINGRNTMAGTMASVAYRVVSLKLSSSFNFAKAVRKGQYLVFPFSLSGAGVKYVEWYVDGTKLGIVDTYSEIEVNREKNLDTAELTTGKHNIQVRAYTTENEQNFYSSTLYYDFVVSPSNGVWASNTTYPLLGLNLSQPSTGTLTVNATRYEEFFFSAAVFDSRRRSLPLVISDNSEAVKSITTFADETQSSVYVPYVVGSHTLTFSVDGVDSTITVDVAEGEIDISEATDGLMLKLSAKGRSNNEASKNVWKYGNITTSFTGFRWDEQDGWHDDALIIRQNEFITINLEALSGSFENGRTIQIDYETNDVTNENATILDITNQSTGAGLTINATSASLRSANNSTSVETKYRDGDRNHLTFIINKTSGDDSRFLYIVNNGILERAARFTTTDNFVASGNIRIGSDGCTVRLYGVRVFNRALKVDEAFCNYAIDSPNLISLAAKNDIFDTAAANAISVDKVNSTIPVMIITGDISSILSITDKSKKNDWNTQPVQIEFRDMQHPERNFFIDDADIRLQGTSSISYPRKNFRIYSKSKSGKYQTKLFSPTHNAADLVENGKYSFKPNAAPVSCWCLKADYAESSGSHNTGVAKLWNTLMYNTSVGGEFELRTNAQNWAKEHNYQYDVRTTIDGFPMVLFQRDSESSPMTCFGQYNFNNDKSTEDVFGFTALTVEDEQGHTESFDNSHVECWEVLDSDKSIALFTDVKEFDTKWGEAFEARYPDKNKNVTAIKRVAEWLNSCFDDFDENGEAKINLEVWQSGKADYFDLPKLAAYYVYLIRFGAVDQTVKNAMFTTEDGEHWFYINYDNDTILGIDNASRLFDVWDYGIRTKTPQGGYYYAGKGKSVLWTCFEADDECMALVRQIDDAMYEAGLRYETVCEMFDDEQSSKWSERIYNINGRFKYIDQALAEQNVLYMLQGSRKSHRHWWLQHRFEKYDNEFGTGTYSRRTILARAASGENIPQGATYKFTPAKSANFGYSVASAVVDPPTHREANTEYTSTGLPEATGVGNLIYIHNANNLYALNLSGYINALGTVNLTSAVDVNGNSELRELVLGDGENVNSYLDGISGLSVIRGLEKLDIRGYRMITNLDISSLPNLTTFRAGNSSLSQFSPAAGATIALAELPSTIQGIILTNSQVTNIDYTPTKTLTSVTIDKVVGAWDVKGFINDWLLLFADNELASISLTLYGIQWTGMTYAQVLRIGQTGKAGDARLSLRGSMGISEAITEGQYNQLLSLYGEEAFNPNSEFYITVPQSVFLTGPTVIKDGETARFSASVFPNDGTNVIKFLLYSNSSTIVSPQTDEDGVYRKYGSLKLYEDTGVAIVDSNISSSTTAIVRISIDGSVYQQKFLTVTAQAITYPSSLTISGSASVVATGNQEYTYSFSTGSYNAELQNVSWTLSDASYISVLSQTGNKVTLQYPSLAPSTTNVTLTCTATFERGRTVVGTKEISLVVTPIESFSLDGTNRIQGTGSYQYYISKILPQTHNINISSLTASISSAQSGAMNVVVNGVAGVTLNVTQMPSEDVALTLTVVATLENGSLITATKIVNFGDVSYFECVYKGNGSTEVSLFGSNSSAVANLTIDGQLVQSTTTWVFNDTNEHTITFTTNRTYQLFAGCGRLVSCSLPSNVTEISSYMFYKCDMLGSISLSNNVTIIRDHAFDHSGGLTSVTIGTGVKGIDKYAFDYCRNLTSVTSLAASSPSIYSNTFRYCGSQVPSGTLKTLNVPANSTGYDTGEWKSQLIDNGYTLNATL